MITERSPGSVAPDCLHNTRSFGLSTVGIGYTGSPLDGPEDGMAEPDGLKPPVHRSPRAVPSRASRHPSADCPPEEPLPEISPTFLMQLPLSTEALQRLGAINVALKSAHP
jgi:hypothetical protein